MFVSKSFFQITYFQITLILNNLLHSIMLIILITLLYKKDLCHNIICERGKVLLAVGYVLCKNVLNTVYIYA